MTQSPYITSFLDFTRKILFKIFKNEKIRTIISKFTEYEVFTYLIFGVFTTLVDMVIYYSLVYLGVDEVLTNILSSTVAILFAYVTNKRWVFESKAETRKDTFMELVKFFEARVFTLLLSTLIIWVFQLLHWSPYIAKIIAMILTVVLNYILSKFFIFTSNKKGIENNAN